MLIGSACETDIPNPNAATNEDVLSSTDGLVGLVVGIQLRYTNGGASGLYSAITANGLSTDELTVLNAGNTEIAALENGGDNVSPRNGVVTNLWTNLNIMIADAQDLIDNANNIGDPGTAAGVQAFGHLYKALALGTVAMFWEQGVVDPAELGSGENASFVSREAALGEAVLLLDQASDLIASVNVPESFFNSVGSNIDLENALPALSARYNIMLGDNEAALDKANEVDISSTSQFLFDNVTPNPVFRVSLSTQNVYETKEGGTMGLPEELAVDRVNDERYTFYVTEDTATSTFRARGFFKSDEDPIPLYLPGEIMLIKAEALARQNQLNEAVVELNNVLTKTTEEDAFGVGANLPPYSGPVTQDAILTEIYRNRAIELYMSGLKLEDSRRFGRSGPNDANPERNRNFYPYPNAERDNNPNTPANPSI